MATCLKSPPTHLQQQALLWIHALRLSTADPKKSRVKLIQTVHQASPADVLAQGTTGIRIKVLSEIPSRPGNLLDGITPLNQQLPKIVWAFDTTGQAATHTENRNRFLLCCWIALHQPRASGPSKRSWRIASRSPNSWQRSTRSLSC